MGPDEEIVEFSWDCAICTKRNLGRHKKCQQCGQPIPDDVKWIAPDDSAPAVTEAALLRQASAGVDWTCSFCGTLTSALNGVCHSCHVGRGDGENRTRTEARAHEIGGSPEPVEDRSSIPTMRSALWRTFSRVTLPVMAAGLVTGLLWHACVPRTVHAQVMAVSWEQRVNVERRTFTQHEDWHSAVPFSANLVDCQTRQRGTHEVVDHYVPVPVLHQGACDSWTTSGRHLLLGASSARSSGNGFGVRPAPAPSRPSSGGWGGGTSRPVYSPPAPVRRCSHYASSVSIEQHPVYRLEPTWEQWCRYQVEEWPVVRTVVKSGSTDPPVWPADSEVELRGDERTRRVGTYSVSFADGGETWSKPVEATELGAFKVGDRWRLSVSRVSVGIVAREGP